MRIVDRFTRDRASRFVWGGLTLVSVLGLVFALQAEQRSLDDEIEAANERTTRYASTVVRDMVATESLSSTELEFRFLDMMVAAQAGIFTDETVARFRIWDVEGVLRFSTDLPRGDIGTLAVEDRRVLDAIEQAQTSFSQTTEPFTQATTGRDGEPTRLLQTFVPLKVEERIEPLGAVQVDYLYDRLVENARDPWLQLQVIFAGVVGVFALLTILSLRKPLPKRAAVPAVASDEPVDDRAEARVAASSALGEELEVAREQLKQAEEAYHYLEARLKKTQDELTRTGAEPAPEIVQQIAAADRDRELAEARAEAAEQRLAEMQRRLERAASDPSAPPAVVADAAPIATNGTATSPSPSDRTPLASSRAERAAAPSPAPPASERDREPVAEPQPAAEREPGEERRPEPVGAAAETDDAAPSDPASDLRARLARTAARKKLGPNVSD